VNAANVLRQKLGHESLFRERERERERRGKQRMRERGESSVPIAGK